MKASKVVELLQKLIRTHGDLNVEVYKQTGPDSWKMAPVTGLTISHEPYHNRVLEVLIE